MLRYVLLLRQKLSPHGGPIMPHTPQLPCTIYVARSSPCRRQSSLQMAAGRGAESLQSCQSKPEHIGLCRCVYVSVPGLLCGRVGCAEAGLSGFIPC